MRSGIYKIENTATGKIYIGSAVVLKRRLRDHRYLLSKGQHPNRYLQAAWAKHGEDFFTFSSLIVCSKDNLLFYEQRFIDAYRAGGLYNLRPNATSQLGFRHSEETRKKFRSCPQLMSGKIVSAETCASISMALMGHAVSDKHRETTAARFKGKKLSEQHRAKLSLAKKGRKQDPKDVAKRALSNTGKKRSKETRDRMAVAQRLRYMLEAQI